MRISTHRHPGLIVHSHRFQVPLNHSVPDGDKIAVFARELLPANKPDSTDPYIVYLQGGPGFACRPPISKELDFSRTAGGGAAISGGQLCRAASTLIKRYGITQAHCRFLVRTLIFVLALVLFLRAACTGTCAATVCGFFCG